MQWEYLPHSSFRLTKEQLDQLGDDEWELVSHFICSGIHEDTHEYTFKRPKRETSKPPKDSDPTGQKFLT